MSEPITADEVHPLAGPSINAYGEGDEPGSHADRTDHVEVSAAISCS